MPRQETIQFRSLGASIVGRLFLPRQLQVSPVVVICHGAFDYKEHFFELAETLAGQGIGSLVLDMHGHGESEGQRYHVRMEEWVEDLRCALKYLQQRTDVVHGAIGAFGFSSGGTAVLEAAAEGLPFKALVTLDATVRSVLKWYEAPFFRVASLLGTCKTMLGFRELQLPLGFALSQVRAAVDDDVNRAVIQDPYIISAYSRLPLPGSLECFQVDTLKRVHRITSPVCVIHGALDEVDPPATAEMLFSRLRGEKALHILPENGHMGHMDTQKKDVLHLTCEWFKNRL
ncbi:alpha/beta hydrolase [Hahella ganghwensis]|uniref:alpha/beta hydrolase n=1 Tax=Hahella ganghwensis TaxID=286420 RepID=UPI0003A23EE8|nr:alpha/beta fold hydrolase [Hahella ganghwensis]